MATIQMLGLALVLVFSSAGQAQMFPGMGGFGGSTFGSTFGSSYSHTSGSSFGSNFGSNFGGGGMPFGGGMMRRAVPGDHKHAKTLDQALLDLNRVTEVPCIRMIVCQVGAKASTFRHFGELVSDYYRTGQRSNSQLNGMAEVFHMGQKLPDLASCRPRMGTTCMLQDYDLLVRARDLIN